MNIHFYRVTEDEDSNSVTWHNGIKAPGETPSCLNKMHFNPQNSCGGGPTLPRWHHTARRNLVHLRYLRDNRQRFLSHDSQRCSRWSGINLWTPRWSIDTLFFFFLRGEGWEGGGKVVAAFGGFMISTGGTYKLTLLNMNWSWSYFFAPRTFT